MDEWQRREEGGGVEGRVVKLGKWLVLVGSVLVSSHGALGIVLPRPPRSHPRLRPILSLHHVFPRRRHPPLSISSSLFSVLVFFYVSDTSSHLPRKARGTFLSMGKSFHSPASSPLL